MIAALFGSALMHINIAVIIFLALIMISLIIGIHFKNKKIMKYSKALIHLLLGLFGVFRCQDGKDYCYLGFKLGGSKLAVALLLELGMVVFATHVGVTLFLLGAGVTALHTISSPVIGYFIYPALLACFRKKCS